MEFHGPRTQILLQDSATNGTTVIYTVPANKKLFLIWSMLEGEGAIGEAALQIRNGADVVQINIGHMDIGATTGIDPGNHFAPDWPPELVAGWDIAVVSSIAALVATGNIFGYEVDA